MDKKSSVNLVVVTIPRILPRNSYLAGNAESNVNTIEFSKKSAASQTKGKMIIAFLRYL